MTLGDWSDFFVAAAGASAGLAGLIIVAMSVNIEVILAGKSLPSRAGATIASLVLVVVASIAALIPDVDDRAYGAIVLAVALIAVGLAVDSSVRIFQERAAAPPFTFVVKSALVLVPVTLVAIGGVIQLLGSPAGLYWVAAGVLAIFVGSVLNAWVLLVEIRR
jgi:modulator of FtsH protease